MGPGAVYDLPIWCDGTLTADAHDKTGILALPGDSLDGGLDSHDPRCWTGDRVGRDQRLDCDPGQQFVGHLKIS